jgi:hypothetical protein
MCGASREQSSLRVVPRVTGPVSHGPSTTTSSDVVTVHVPAQINHSRIWSVPANHRQANATDGDGRPVRQGEGGRGRGAVPEVDRDRR